MTTQPNGTPDPEIAPIEIPESSPELRRVIVRRVRRLDLSGSGIDATKIPEPAILKIARATLEALVIVERRAVNPETPPAESYVPPGLGLCPRCGVYRGVETIRAVDDGDPRPACWIDVPPTRAERSAAAEVSRELAESGPVAVEEPEPDLSADDPPVEEGTPA